MGFDMKENKKIARIFGAIEPIKAMQRDEEILPVSIRMKEIRDRFAICAIRDVSPRNPVWDMDTFMENSAPSNV